MPNAREIREDQAEGAAFSGFQGSERGLMAASVVPTSFAILVRDIAPLWPVPYSGDVRRAFQHPEGEVIMRFPLPARVRRWLGFGSSSPAEGRAVSLDDTAASSSAPSSSAIANPRERTVDQALDFTFLCVDMYLALPSNGLEAFRGGTVMEIGPGQDLGILLVLAGLGSGRGIAVDRFFCDWDPSYHPEFYSRLLPAAEARYPGSRFEAVRDIVDNRDHKSQRLQIVRSGLADLSSLPSESVDICYSNAALEHLERPREGLLELARVSRKGGLGFHQIDFRDHRDFDRPLEFLTMSDQEFEEKAEAASYSFGNRLRPGEYLQLFNQAGFDASFTPNLFAERDYVAEVAGRLKSRYRSFTSEELGQTSGRVFTTRR